MPLFTSNNLILNLLAKKKRLNSLLILSPISENVTIKFYVYQICLWTAFIIRNAVYVVVFQSIRRTRRVDCHCFDLLWNWHFDWTIIYLIVSIHSEYGWSSVYTRTNSSIKIIINAFKVSKWISSHFGESKTVHRTKDQELNWKLLLVLVLSPLIWLWRRENV